MKGYNEFYINEATLKLAVQHYFDTVLFMKGMAPKVAGIKPGMNRLGTDGFTVHVTDEPEVTR